VNLPSELEHKTFFDVNNENSACQRRALFMVGEPMVVTCIIEGMWRRRRRQRGGERWIGMKGEVGIGGREIGGGESDGMYEYDLDRSAVR
jgi:hypothetical protein